MPSLLLHQWMSSSIIMHSFMVLLLCQCMNSLVYGEISLPPLPLCLSFTLSLSLFLLFQIFKCQLYLCGLSAVWRFDVFSFSVFGFCVCKWELISKCSCRCFFSVLVKIKDKRSQSASPLHAVSISHSDVSLQLSIFRIKCSPCIDYRVVWAVNVEDNKEYQGSGVSWL